MNKFNEKNITIRISKEIKLKMDKLKNSFPNDFPNDSLLIRASIIRLYNLKFKGDDKS